MPKRYIQIPKAVQSRDPGTKEPIFTVEGKPDMLSLFLIHSKIMHNPKWGDNYKNMRAAEAIEEAFESALKSGSKYVELSEDDWVIYAEAAENPKTMFIGERGPVVMPGLGFHPTMVRQILPFLRPIIEAKDVRPVEEVAVEAA